MGREGKGPQEETQGPRQDKLLRGHVLKTQHCCVLGISVPARGRGGSDGYKAVWESGTILFVASIFNTNPSVSQVY